MVRPIDGQKQNKNCVKYDKNAMERFISVGNFVRDISDDNYCLRTFDIGNRRDD